MQITHYDLFAGIGGFSYALDTIFNDAQIKHIFCEWEAFPTAVLKKHWPDATYYGDIADLVADTERTRRQGELRNTEGQHRLRDRSRENQDFTILTGGFPCQPFSHAGRRQGTADDRYKWPDMFAVIQNVRPDWVIAENVRGLVTWNEGLVLETVCADLESEGYEVQPLVIPAVAIGAPHRRDRVWIVAHNKSTGTRQDIRGLRALSERCDERKQRLGHKEWNTDWREVAFATCHDGVDDGLSYRLHGATSRGKRTDTISASQHRKERLKACGNAIVPQVAMEIFSAIKHATISP